MPSPSLLTLLVFALASLSFGGLFVAVFYQQVTKPQAFRQRFERIAAFKTQVQEPATDGSRDRRKSVEKTLRELEEKQKAKSRKSGRPNLTGRMRQGGLTWTRKGYYLACLMAALASYTAAFLFGVSPVVALGFGFSGGLILPHLYVGRKRSARFKQFTAEFPNAIDVVVRGLKAGLPVADCLRVIASEAQEPVRSEFAAIVQDQTLGLPLDEAVQRLYERVPLPEANFFAIVIAIQSRTGGSLSEALGNLSKVLRERKKMGAKIKAMSAEAKSSAMIIGALPFFVSGAVYLTSPDYISLLFTTMTGNIVIGICGLWMAMGIFVMRRMINFDF